MIKAIIIYILLAITGISQAQQQSSLLVCSPYKNEIARYGAPVFMLDGKYCILLGDNSYQVLEELFGDIEEALKNTYISILEAISEEGVISIEDVTKDVCKQNKLLCETNNDALDSDNQAFIDYSQGGSSPKDKAGYPPLPSWVTEKQEEDTPDNWLAGIRHFDTEQGLEECKKELNFAIWFWDCDSTWGEDMGIQ